jgi:signal transduction histidine kinase
VAETLKALTNVAKHARARYAEVTARIEERLVGLADRLASIDGVLRVETPSAGGTLITAAIPLAGSAADSEARP